MMTEEVLAEYEDEDIVLESAVDEEKMLFPVEGEDGPSFPVAQPLRAAATKSSSGISKRLAAKYGLSTTTSNFDYGVRMRQSFRVGEKPYCQ